MLDAATFVLGWKSLSACKSAVRKLWGCVASLLLLAPLCCFAAPDTPSIALSSLPRLGTVDERFQSYNIEMVEVTGGEFWKPYQPKSAGVPQRGSRSTTLDGLDARLFQYRPPIDLTDMRLRRLAAALGPAYVRVSGTWANATYFADSDQPPALPPPGFKTILTRPQWQGAVRFAQSVNAELVTSFGIDLGNRNGTGVWRSDQSQRLLAYTRSIGGRIAAAEFMNEPDLALMGGTPAGYDAFAFGRDFKLFHSLMKRESPATIILGPGTVGESPATSQLLAVSAAGVDAVSYHYYNTVSERCGGMDTPDEALSEDWLSGTGRVLAFYQGLRDRLAPGKPIWLTETADAACGGNPWAADFLDVFRYLDQLGRLARAGVQVVIHNTLAASDYGLLDEATLQPRPKYWGALLWRRLMGTTVLDAGIPIQSGLHVYAHCQRGVPGGVSLLVINTDRDASRMLNLPAASIRYTLDAARLSDKEVRLNGTTLRLNRDELPALAGLPNPSGMVTFAPATISFLANPGAANVSCR